MGKLHTLRRAIERNPGSFRGYAGRAKGAGVWRGKWVASYWTRAYQAFVQHVLDGLGQ